MRTMRLAQLAAWADGELKGADAPVAGIGTDTRALRDGELFVALKGENFDGHDFAAQCEGRAAGVMVARELAVGCPQIVVPDPLTALQRIAAAWRAEHDVVVAGITGSNGKTTTKEMTAAVLAAEGQTLASQGNLNNHIGVPLTLLGLDGEHQYAVIEMGANHPGEIRRLTALARPQAATVTCAAQAHLEGFGSLQGVARAKAEIFEGLGPEGVAVVNAEDAFAFQWRTAAAPHEVMTFSADPQVVADIYARLTAPSRLELRFGNESAEIDWTLEGTHNARNAACAVTLAVALGIPFGRAAQALSGFRLAVGGRLRLVEGLGGAQLIDDSYNANPGSFHAAIDVLVAQGRESWMVMGEMKELGLYSAECHEEVADYARKAGVSRLYALGPHAGRAARAFGPGGQACPDLEALADELRAQVGPQCTVLVKGSRAARLEDLVERLMPGGQAHAA